MWLRAILRWISFILSCKNCQATLILLLQDLLSNQLSHNPILYPTPWKSLLHHFTYKYMLSWNHSQLFLVPYFFHYTGARKKDPCIFPAEWWNEINFELLLQSKTFIECFLSNVLWRNKWMEEEIAEGKGKLTGFWWVAAMQSSLLCPLPVIFHDNCCQIPANTIKPPLIFSPKNLGRKKRLVIYTHIK